MERNIYIRNKVKNGELNSDDILLLVLMQEYRRLGREDKDFPMTCSFTIEMLLNDFNINTRRNVESIIQSYYNLIEKGYIREIQVQNTKINKSTPITVGIIMAADDEYYNNIDFTLIYKIVDTKSDIKSIKSMIYMLVALISYRGANEYAYPTIEQLSISTGMSESTLHKAKEMLSEIDVIAYGNNGVYTDSETGEIRSDNNKYVIADMDNFKEILNKHIKHNNNNKSKTKEESNNHRSNTLKMKNSIKRATMLAEQGYSDTSEEMMVEKQIFIPLVHKYMERELEQHQIDTLYNQISILNDMLKQNI